MQLKKVEIKGFRSIEHMELTFDGCGHKVLVGKNECGKSNILKALNLLSANTTFEGKDKKEGYDGEAFVKFIFDLGDSEIEECRQEFYELLFASSPQTRLTKDLTIKGFFEEYSRGMFYCVNEGGVRNHELCQDPSSELTTNSNWYRITEGLLNAYPGLQEESQLVAGAFVNEEFIKKHSIAEDKQNGLLESVGLQVIYDELSAIVGRVAIPSDNYSFPVINWIYSATEHDLPTFLKKGTFVSNPNNCIPLKNMFLLANIQEDDIGKKISSVEGNYNKFQNLLDRVVEGTNEYIKKAWREYWKEYKEVRISLRSDGPYIVVGVKDSEHQFDFEQRSDGFRRFISFLLLMSTETNKNEIDKKLIIIDEPEVGLHPSSAKNLRDKLIELGKTNLVVYATHSISMIDTENIENNLVVTKKNENTMYQVAQPDGIASAENVYQAIGYSVYEELKPRNILVEGITDKSVLCDFMQGDEWGSIGVCSTDGVGNIKAVTSNLELVDRKCFILSDADEAAMKNKKNWDNSRGYWFTYKDLDSEAVTIEDFYKEQFYKKIVKEVFNNKGINFADGDKLFPDQDRLKAIKAFLNRKKVGQEVIKEITRKIKDKLYESHERADVKATEVKAVLRTLLQKIDSHKG